MGNKIVCCRWRWSESPDFRNNNNNNHDEANKYSNCIAVEDYPSNGGGVLPINQKVNIENGFIHQPVYKTPNYDQNINKIMNNNNRTLIYENNYPTTNFVCPAPFYPSNNNTANVPKQMRYLQHCYSNNLESSTYRDSWMMKSTELLQHISEREPEDVENDPSINAKKPTLFFKRSKDEIEQNIQQRRQEFDRKAVVIAGLRPWSSCSNILLDDTTISQPAPALALKTLALAIHLHVRSDVPPDNERFHCSRDDAVYEIFDERHHPVFRNQNTHNNNVHHYGHHQNIVSQSSSNTSSGLMNDYSKAPSHREIYRFLRGIFNMAQLTPECAIVTLVYLERLLTSAEMEILPWSWRRQVLASVLLASKVWDDQAVWNADYCQILKDLCVEDVNELERVFLELIQFNINVPSSVYAHYYFDLLQLGRAHGLCGLPHTRHLLTWDRAIRLEALTCPPGPLNDHSPDWWTNQNTSKHASANKNGASQKSSNHNATNLHRFPSWESIYMPMGSRKKAIVS